MAVNILSKAENRYHILVHLLIVEWQFFSAATKILYSNGLIDPWISGGILSTTNPENIIVLIADAAHHLDLRGADPSDPPSVIDARNQEKAAIRKWIQEHRDMID